jgi:hypothetical protein
MRAAVGGGVLAPDGDMDITTRLAVIVLALLAAAPVRAQAPDLSPWDGAWFKTKVKQKGVEFHATAPGTKKDRFGGVVYVQLLFDAGAPDRLGMDVWIHESDWQKQSIPLVYVAGANDDALFVFNQIPVSPAPVTAPILQFGFAARLAGKIAGSVVGKGSLKTLGGYFVEIDDVPGSDLRAAGSLSLSGKTTTKLPPDLPHD